jgi:hypothetical protein
MSFRCEKGIQRQPPTMVEEFYMNMADAPSKSTLPLFLNKVEGFGLGSLARLDPKCSAAHAHTKHAALETIAKILEKKGDVDVICYA